MMSMVPCLTKILSSPLHVPRYLRYNRIQFKQELRGAIFANRELTVITDKQDVQTYVRVQYYVQFLCAEKVQLQSSEFDEHLMKDYQVLLVKHVVAFGYFRID